MKRHLIFMDIDGTLVDNQQQITPITREVITNLQAEGHLFYVATGRKYSSAAQIAGKLNQQVQVVASNGSIFQTNQAMHRHQLALEALSEIFQTTSALDLTTFFFGEHTIFHTGELPGYFQVEDQNRIANSTDEDFIAIHSQADLDRWASKIINGIIIDEDYERLAKVRTELEQSPLLTVSSSHANNIELIPRGINKATAIKEIQTFYDIPKERTISFGDGCNDLEMLAASSISVAMGNAAEPVKQQARFLTDTNLNDGIAQFLTNYFKKGTIQ